jgi:streptogramin lyase
MDRFSADLDRQLGVWLRDEATARASAGLIEAVFARTSQTRQARRPWSLGLGGGQWLPRLAPVLGGAAVAVIVLAIGVSVLQPRTGPGGTPTPGPSPSVRAVSTPQAALLGNASALRLPLGNDFAPIDVVGAFDSIWVAGIHADQVRRLDPTTMAEVARIDVTGPAWFLEADGALWVTQQVGVGLTRIDPDANTVVGHVGDVPPCGAPVFALGSIWASACDAGVYLRIDPATTAITDTIPAQGHRWVVFAAGDLITLGTDGLARLDPAARTFTGVPGSLGGDAELIGSDGATVWLRLGNDVVRIDPSDGHTVATFPYSSASSVTFSNGHAWLSVNFVGIVEIDLATNTVMRTIPLPAADITREVGSALWTTDFTNADLWRIEP